MFVTTQREKKMNKYKNINEQVEQELDEGEDEEELDEVVDAEE